MAKQTEKKEAFQFTLPKGRMINGSLFIKDKFDEKATPSYKIEVAFPKDGDFDAVIEKLLEFVDNTWPGLKDKDAELNIDGGNIISGIIDGDRLAAKREKDGKKGDAYKGMWVIRASTIYNHEGRDGDGGVQVWDAAVKPVEPTDAGKVYNGCYVKVAVSLGNYEDDRSGNNGIKFYLNAVQKVDDGEKLVAQRDTSVLFKPVGRTEGAAESTTRSRRKG